MCHINASQVEVISLTLNEQFLLRWSKTRPPCCGQQPVSSAAPAAWGLSLSGQSELQACIALEPGAL